MKIYAATVSDSPLLRQLSGQEIGLKSKQSDLVPFNLKSDMS
jgi:hypothetical protein